MANAAATPAAPALTLADPVMGEQLRLTDAAVLGRNAFSSMASNFAMSRQHASVRFERGTWMVADEGSNNGTALMRGGQILNLVPGAAASRFIPAIRYSFRLRLASLPNCV